MKEAESIFGKMWAICLIAMIVEFARVLLILVQGNGANVTILTGLLICFITFSVALIILVRRNNKQ